MTNLEETFGKDDENVVSLRLGIGGFVVVHGATDAEIAAFAVEEAQEIRRRMEEAGIDEDLGISFTSRRKEEEDMEGDKLLAAFNLLRQGLRGS